MEPVIHRFDVLDSTQDEARRLLDAGKADVGHVVVADEQRAGRGRFGRTWLSPRGGLYVTFIVERLPNPSIQAGLAVVRALGELGLEARLKWPNDVRVGGKKLAGILIDTADALLLVGVGANLRSAPLPTASSTEDCGLNVRRDGLIEALWRSLGGRRSLGEVMDAYRAVCSTIGRSVRVLRAGGGRPIEGVAVDVDSEGRLVVETSAGRLAIASGECEHLEDAPPPVDGRAAGD